MCMDIISLVVSGRFTPSTVSSETDLVSRKEEKGMRPTNSMASHEWGRAIEAYLVSARGGSDGRGGEKSCMDIKMPLSRAEGVLRILMSALPEEG